MKKRVVQTITQSGNQFGQVSHPNDLMKAQDFVHERINNLAQDFLNSQKQHEVVGFTYALGGGNSFQITILKPGRVHAINGTVYDLLANTPLTIAQNATGNPRLDLIVATLEDEVSAELALIPFVRLRTNTEFSQNLPPYPPQNINAPQEKHWRAVVSVKTGTPSALPIPPTLNSNEIPLYLINVAPGATQIRDIDIADWRQVILTLRSVNSIVSNNSAGLASLTRRVESLEQAENQPIDLSGIFGSIKSLGAILASHEFQIRALRDLPDVRFVRPKVPLTNPESSKIPASGNTETVGIIVTPVVDIEIGGTINFGDKEIILRPENFDDTTRNARFFKIIDVPEIVKTETALTLANVTQTAADGFTDFVEKASEFLASRSRPAAAARNDQYVEIFGGLASDNASSLSDWLTYDVTNDTLTPRAPILSLPDADRPAIFSYGDGTHVLLICGMTSNSAPRCFKLNCATGGVTEITTTKPTGIQFYGDLISTGRIFIVAVRSTVSGYETDFWEFNTTTNAFTQLGVTGSIPALTLDYASGCFFQPDEFVLVKFTKGITSSGKTYVFNRTSLTWAELNISAPFGDAPDKQSPLQGFRMANVNGRPLLLGGLLKKDTDATKAKVWELRNFDALYQDGGWKWQSFDATFPPVQEPGFCSTLSGNLPRGKAAFFAGSGKFSNAQNHVYASVQGGLIETTYKGQPAITLAESSTFAQFIVPIYNVGFDVAAYLLSLVGNFDESNLKCEVSFDSMNYHKVAPDKMTLISDSATPGIRSLRITLYNLKTSKPVLARMVEIYDEDGDDLETRIVIRYDAPATAKALYVDRDGIITLSSIIEPSTPNKCLLHKVTPDGSNAPTLKNYINRRRPHIKYSKVKSGTVSSAQFDNELAVPVRYVNAQAFAAADNHLYKITEPTVAFDSLISVTAIGGGAITNGDTWEVELEG